MIACLGSFKPQFFMMRLTIIGFGNQAMAWSQNLRDSGFPFRVALLPDSHSFVKTKNFGIETVIIGSKEFYEDKAFVLLIPDHAHESFMNQYAASFTPGSLVIYNHGFSITKNKFNESFPKLNHLLFAVKAIGSEIRTQFLAKGKLGAVYSMEYASDKEEVFSWLQSMSKALGINIGLFKTTFKHETQADLFSEQGLLCSLIPYTADLMFRELVAQGIEPELAYLECWHELKLIVNAMVDKGPAGFYDLISPNALIGSEKGYNKLITPEFKSNLNNLLKDIQNNQFDQELDKANLKELRETITNRWKASPLDQTFNKLNQEPHK
jgi:ketol-acid reductoisomerase